MKHIHLSVLLTGILLAGATYAQVPKTISIQGVLTDADGRVVADGSHDLTLGIYVFSSGSSPIWMESHEDVPVTSGVFNVILGSVVPLDIPFDTPYFLGVTIGGDQELTPRIPFTASAYSLFTLDIADDAITTVKLADNAVTADKIAPDVISSLDGVRNDAGNIDLLAGENISIVPNDEANTITISATGNAAGDISGVNAGIGLTGGGQEGPVNIGLDTNFTDNRYLNEGQDNSVTNNMVQDNAITLTKIAPDVVSSISGVSNDGGNVSLVAGANITISPNDEENTITITAINPGGGATGVLQINPGNGITVNDPAGPTTTVSVSQNSLNDDEIQDNSLTEISLAAGAVGNSEIQPNAVTVDKILPDVISSINGVRNDGSNIDLIPGQNITIIPNDFTNSISISATGVQQVAPGTAINVANQAGLVAIVSVAPNSITDNEILDNSLTGLSLAPNSVGSSEIQANAVGTSEIQNNAVTVEKILPNILSSLDGVTNDGGNINLLSGPGISIVPNDANKTITISAAGSGGGTGNISQLTEGSNISIQNVFGPVPVIGLKPNIRLGPLGSLDILNGNSLSVLALDVNNNNGGFFGLRNQDATEVVRISTLDDRQPRLRLSNRLGNPVADLFANQFSDGELTLSSVLQNLTIQLTANDDASGLINVFNSNGLITSRLTNSTTGNGRLILNSVNNNLVLDLKTNSAGGGLLQLFNVEGTEAVRLTTFETYGGSVRVSNRAGLVAARLNATTTGDGNLSIFNQNEQEAVYLSVNNNGGGFLGIRNGENAEVARISTLQNSQPRLLLSNRLGGPVADLRANEFSDGELQLYAVLNNPTLRLTANAGGGGLINVFNPAEAIAAVLTDDGGGYFGLFNSDETEIIQLSTFGDRNARVRVNNRLGNPAADLVSNEFSDGQLTLYSVLENPTVLLGANDNAGGLITVLNKGGNPSAVMTEIEGYGGVAVFSPSQAPLASMNGSTTTGFGEFTVYHNDENSIMAQMTRDANENGALGIFNRYQFPIVRLGGNDNSDGQVGIFDVAGLRMAELIKDPESLGGKLNIFNKDANRAASLLAGFNGSGLLQLFNNLNNLSAGYLAEDTGGRLFINNGSPLQSPRVDLGTTPTGSRLLLYSNETNLVHSMTVKPSGEGLFEMLSKKNYPKSAVEMGVDDISAGYLKLSSSLGMNTSFLGNDLFNDGTLELRNNAGNIGGYFTAFRDGGSLVVTDGNPGINHRAALEAGLNGGRMAIYNKDIKLVGDLGVANNGEAWLRIISKQDLTKNRMELGGDDAGAGYSRFYNNNAQKTAEIGAMADASGFMSTYSAGGKRQTLISSANNGGGVSIFNSTDKIIGSLNTASNQGGEMNIYNVNGANTSKLSNGGSGAGMLEIGTSAGDKVARVTTLDGTGYIGLDNVDKKEVVRLTANLGKGGGIGLKNAALFDMINLTQDNNFGAILLNNATGGLMTNITHNTSGGAFIGTKDQNGKDAIWLTTGIAGGGHFNTFNSLGNAALTLNSNASNIGNVSVHSSAGNEIARVSGFSNGIGFVGIFNNGGFGLAGLTNNNTTLGGYIYAQTAAGKDVARMTTTSAGGGVIAITGPVGTAAISYLTSNNQNGGYVGVATSAGNDRARITTNTGGSGIMSVSNTSGNDVVEATVSAANHGTVATYNASGANIAGLLATTTGQGYIRASNSAGNEKAFMSAEEADGEIGVRDASGNRRARIRGNGVLEVVDADGSYFNASAFGSGVQLFLVDKLQHPRMEIKAGEILVKGPNGIEHSFISTTNGSNLGYIGVCNSNIVNSPVKAGMYTNDANQGVLFADIKNFKMDYPGKADKQIWYGSLEGPELAAYIRGTGKLINGKATIEFTDHYQKVANTGTMTVILTPLSGKSKGLAVVHKSGTGFQVEELLEGSGSYEFDWEVKCVRKGHEGFEVVRNKSQDPKPFINGNDQPQQLLPGNSIKIEPDAIIKANQLIKEKLNAQ